MPPQSIPLEKIRQVESEVAEQIRQARQAAQDRIEEARRQAGRIKEQAIENGRSRGLDRYQQQIREAEAEAEKILQSAIEQAAQINLTAARNMDFVVEQAALWVAGLKEDEV